MNPASKFGSEPSRTPMDNVFYRPSGTAPGAHAAPRWLEWSGSGRILVVDDEEAVRIVVSRVVAKLGFTAELASDAQEALSMFSVDPGRFVLALVDVRLPGVNGMDIAREFRLLKPDLPVILMSGYSRHEAANPTSSQIPIGFLQKPFTLESLASAMRIALETQFRRESK
jgi:two-component system, cell cycle sensor histidine kinase and response regulator CckA